MTEERQCVRCGGRIPEGSEYCPSCGAASDGSAYEHRAETVYMDSRRYGRRPVSYTHLTLPTKRIV